MRIYFLVSGGVVQRPDVFQELNFWEYITGEICGYTKAFCCWKYFGKGHFGFFPEYIFFKCIEGYDCFCIKCE